MESNSPELQKELKEKARAVVNFKIHLTVFLLANSLIWIIWFFLFYTFSVSQLWAVFPTLTWVVVIIFHYVWVYKWNKKQIEKEYAKLLKKYSQSQSVEDKNKPPQDNNISVQ